MRDESAPVWTPSPLPAVNTLRSPPTESQLFEFAVASKNNSSKRYCMKWSLTAPDVYLILNVSSLSPSETTGWLDRAVQVQSAGEPQWVLYKENKGEHEELWTLRTGDLLLLSNLISAQSDPSKSALRPANLAARDDFHARTETRSSGELQRNVMNRLGLTAPVIPHASKSPEAGLLLAGNMKDIDISGVLQSISVCNMTGKLSIHQRLKQLELYFVNGELLHARACDALQGAAELVGDSVVLDMFTWDEGFFEFKPGWQVEHRSVQKKLYALLLEGAALQDYRHSLREQGLLPNSFLQVSAVASLMSEVDFDSALKGGIPINLDLQKRIFLCLKVARPLSQVVYELEIPGSVWIPIIFNLLDLKLLEIKS